MNRLQICIVVVLAIALPYSSWAASGPFAMQLQMSAMAMHDHDGGSAVDASDAHHNASHIEAMSAHYCACGDGCAKMCAVPGCSAAAIDSDAAASLPPDSGGAPRQVRSLHAGPVLQSPFRPPISLI